MRTIWQADHDDLGLYSKSRLSLWLPARVHLIVDLPKRTVIGNNVYRNGEVDPKLTELLRRMLH